MSLIKCNDCHSEISTTAETCPKCGAITEHGKLIRAEKSFSRTGIYCMVVGAVATVTLGPAYLVPAFAGYAMNVFKGPLARFSRKPKKNSAGEESKP